MCAETVEEKAMAAAMSIAFVEGMSMLRRLCVEILKRALVDVDVLRARRRDSQDIDDVDS